MDLCYVSWTHISPTIIFFIWLKTSSINHPTLVLYVGMRDTRVKSYRWSGGQSRGCRWPWGEGDACGFLGPPPLEWSSWRRCCRYAGTAGTLEPAWTLPWHGGSQRYASWEDGCRDAGSIHGDLCWEHHGRFERHSLRRQRSRVFSPQLRADCTESVWHMQVWSDAIPVVPPPGGVLTDITPG